MPFALPALASGLLWKIGAVGTGILAVVLAFFLFTTQAENRSLSKERDKLQLAINDPNTGYIARLVQSRNNVIVLEQAVKTQNEAMVKQSNAAKAELARLKNELTAAQARTRESERRLSAFMATKPQGNTLEERVRDVDNRILQDLKR